MTKSSVIRFSIGLVLGLILAALIAFNALLIWVASGPRSLHKFTPYIEQALAGESDVHAKIGETWLIWDGWKRPIDLRLRNVSLLTPEGETVSTFPEISVGMDVLSLPFGRLLPTSLSVSKPIISIKQNEDKSLGFGGEEKPEKIRTGGDAFAALVESLINPRSKSSLRKLRSIELLNANISIGSEAKGVIITAPDATLIIRKESADRINAVVNTIIEYQNQQSSISGTFAYNKPVKRFEGVAEVGKLYPPMLTELLPDDPWLGALQFPVSGKLGFSFTRKGALDTLQFAITGGRGKIVHERLDGTLPITSLSLEGKADNNLKNITLSKAAVDFGGSPFNGTAQINQTDQGLGIVADISIADVPSEQARRFWPLGLAPLSRDWVVSNIRDGGITKATAKFNIKPGDLALPALPKEAVDARIELKDARIRYMEGHPEVRNVDSLIKVDGMSLDAAVYTASAFSGTKLSNGRVYIADLNPDNPLIEVSLHADAPADDIVTLLGLPMLEHAGHLNLDAKKVSGRATGDAKLGFYFFEKDENGKELPFTYEVTAKLDHVTTPAFLDQFDIRDANGDLTVDDKAIVFKGSATVNTAPITNGTIRYNYTPIEGVDTVIEANTSVNEETLKAFGIDLPVAFKETAHVAVAANLSTQKDATSFQNFSVKGEGIDITGNAKLTSDGKDLGTMKLTKLLHGRTNLSSLEYRSIEGGFALSMNGPVLDLNPFLEKEGDGFSFENFPAVDLDVTAGTLYAMHGQEMQNAKARLICTPAKCTNGNMRADIGDQDVIFTIKPEGKNRRVSITSGDAGAVLRGTGLLESMQGGALNVTGIFKDTNGGQLAGTVNIRDYVMKDAPVLADMLSLISLTGFLDTLSGNGIAFKKLTLPFTLHNDVITIKDAKTYGPAIGLTANGTVTFPASTLDIEGTIIPSYTLNNVVGKVPLLGDILTGGKGEGVFAANYKMTGDTEDPKVSVNPLSILTPGFLRDVFDVF